MKGLLLKDFYMLIQSSKYYLFIICIFAVCSSFSGNSAFLLFCLFFIGSVISFNLISFDEKSRWSSYCGAFPYTRSELVSVKYIMTIFCIATAIVINILLHGIGILFTGNGDWSNYLGLLFCLFPVGVVAPSILLPATFKFGVEKGRLVNYIIFVVVGGCLGGLTALNAKVDYDLTTFTFSTKEIFISLGIGIVIFAVSWLASIRIYKNKEL